jgi:glycerate kinase
MIKVTASLNNKIEEFFMMTQEQLDSAIDILDANGYVILAVSEGK